MTASDPLPPAVTDRKAIVYVRQSTQAQVEANTEGRRRQYELVDLARHRGFRAVEVIDDDPGLSASGMVARPGFERLVAALCAGEVGALKLRRLPADAQWARLAPPAGTVRSRARHG
jgi:DNA invertase Pin-like site-specific DNA recombinase